MTVDAILGTLKARGVQLQLDGGAIRLGPGHRITDDLVHLVAMHKTEILIRGTYAEQLEQRLRTGERMIEATDDLPERARLEVHWLRLLQEYEHAVDAERRQADGRVPA